MKKDITHRIAFYTRKLAERSSVHPSKALPKAYKYRNERLKLYKEMLHNQIERSGVHGKKNTGKSFVIRTKSGMRFESCEVGKLGQEEKYEIIKQAEIALRQLQEVIPFEQFEIIEV